MPYLFHSNKRFTLIDHSSKSGLYCQFFASHASKPIPIANATIKDYCSWQLPHASLYVATLSENASIQLQTLENTHFTKPQLIAQSTSHYTLSDPLLYELDSNMYLTYLSHQHQTNSYSFIQYHIATSQMYTLFSTELSPSQIKHVYVSPLLSYIFFVIPSNQYELYALELTPTQTTLRLCLSSSVPIVDYSICYHHEMLHIAYVAEMHGKYQLSYYNSMTGIATPILTSLSSCQPIIFHYYHSLWINVIIDKSLHMLLSVDQGKSFSNPVRTSLQNNLKRCTFNTDDKSHLCASELYISLGNTLRLCTLAMVDIYHFHFDAAVPPEVALLLEGLSLHAHKAPVLSASSPVTTKTPPPPPTPDALPKEKKQKTNLNAAKKAFMEELSGWDLPPRI